ncbi:MAG: hypothetical protein PUD44_02095, partial [Clostridiaceae bacterium]|nr:hypothetical protein [Clostridiaceae bacterium]
LYCTDFFKEKNEIYRGFLAEMTPGDLSPDTWETLNALKARGVRLVQQKRRIDPVPPWPGIFFRRSG